MPRILDKKFFARSAPEVSMALLGKVLVRRRGQKIEKYSITEVEAYEGLKDKGSHAYRGATKRNQPMFGPAGAWYVYFTYGMHWMLNVVTGKEGYPSAVLIRGIRGIGGPGRLTRALEIDGRFNGVMANRKTGLWIEDAGIAVKKIKKGPRIGINYAGPFWKKRKWRFYVQD